jgi:formyl-CoA transferase
MMALYEREKTGRGRWVQTSLLEAQVFMLDFQATRFLQDGEVAGQAGNDHPVNTPMGVFPAPTSRSTSPPPRPSCGRCSAAPRAAPTGWTSPNGRPPPAAPPTARR